MTEVVIAALAALGLYRMLDALVSHAGWELSPKVVDALFFAVAIAGGVAVTVAGSENLTALAVTGLAVILNKALRLLP